MYWCAGRGGKLLHTQRRRGRDPILLRTTVLGDRLDPDRKETAQDGHLSDPTSEFLRDDARTILSDNSGSTPIAHGSGLTGDPSPPTQREAYWRTKSPGWLSKDSLGGKGKIQIETHSDT